jgi:hypothetical protein
MKAENLNRWLTLGANLGVLVGIILLVAELNQNSTLMRAQIFNERAGHGIAQFMTMAESSELSEIDGLLYVSGFPENAAAFSTLTSTQKTQYSWYLRADRYRVENLLYQQLLGVLEYDPGPVNSGRFLVSTYEAMHEDDFFGEEPTINRLRRLIAEVEDQHQQDD